MKVERVKWGWKSLELKYVMYEKREHVAVVTLNRSEKLNALSKDVFLDLLKALEEAERDPEVRVVVLRGAGRCFCAGADVSEFARSAQEVREFVDLGRKVFEYIETMSKPVIAAVHGYALGGGFELALSCDFIIASSGTALGSPEVNLGLVPGWGASQKLLMTVGPQKARELVMLGEPISADEAFRLGLVYKVVDPEKLLDEAVALAKKLSEKGRETLALIKSLINGSLKSYIAPGLELERSYFLKAVSGEEAREGVRAFLEKRKPRWRG